MNAKNLLQAMHDLCGQRYLRKKVKDLPTFGYMLFYKMDVNLCLSARCDSMQKAYVFAFKALSDII